MADERVGFQASGGAAAAKFVLAPVTQLALRASAGVTVADEVVVLAAGAGNPPQLRPESARCATELGIDLQMRLDRMGATGRAGEVTAIALETPAGQGPQLLLVAGLGEATPEQARRAGANVGRRLRGRQAALDMVAGDLDPDAASAWHEGVLLAAPSLRITGTAAAGPLARMDVANAQGSDESGVPRAAASAPALSRASIVAGATLTARQLAATPSNVKSPQWLADVAVQLGTSAGLSVQVWDASELAENDMGGLLAVGAGSAREPRLVRMDYRPAGATRTVALVGKGITFDSGGLSLKPPEAMIPMKTDMSGAAAVLATMVALPALDIPVAVTGFLAIAENMPGASATRPGDVITHHGGRTTEVINTDAEGRVVLADALALAAAQVRPEVIVDLATLTGAATLGLGRGAAALYSTSQPLAAGIGAAAERSGERVWQMPLHQDYQDRIASEVADAANSDTASGLGPGSITAALFLAPFTGGIPWAHLDIAGPARSDSDRDELPKGATGFGARLLLQWLAAGAPS